MNQVAEVATISETQAPIKFSATKAAINKMAKKWKEVPDVSTKEGYAQAQEAKRELTPMRTAVTKEMGEQKKLAQEHIANINAKGNELVGMIQAIEQPIYDAKKAQDEKVAKEKRETEEKEERRTLAIEAAIEDIQDLTEGLLGADMETLEARLAEADAITITDAVYMEFVEPASQVLDQVKAQLTNAVTTTKALADQQKEMDAQQADIKETQRKADLQESINRIRMAPVDLIGAGVADIQVAMDKLGIINPVDSYGDLAADVTTAIEDTKVKLQAMITQQKGIEDQQAEIGRQKQEQEDAAIQDAAADQRKKDDEDRKKLQKKTAAELARRMPEDIKVRTWMDNILAVEPPDVEDPHLCAIVRDGLLMLSDLNKMVYEGTQSPKDEDND